MANKNERRVPNVGMPVTVIPDEVNSINSSRTSDSEVEALLLYRGLSWGLVSVCSMFSPTSFPCIVKGKLTPDSQIDIIGVDDKGQKFICQVR